MNTPRETVADAIESMADKPALGWLGEADVILAALAEAGYVLCREQVVFDRNYGTYTDLAGNPITPIHGVFVPVESA